jgi:predicted RNase H-like HicB family nuclease
MRLPAVLRSGEDGWIVAECPLIPGCVSQGRTREEAVANIREAIDLCLEGRADEGWSLPEKYEIVDVTVAASF